VELGTTLKPFSTSVGLTVVGLGWSRLVAAPESSRRTAASSTKAAGESAGGAVGVFPANGLNIWLTIAAKAVETLWAGAAAFVVADCVVTVDTDDSVEAVLAVCNLTTVGTGSEVTVDSVFTTTSWVAPLLLFAPAGKETDELGITPVGLDHDPFLVCWGVASPAMLPVLCVSFGPLECDDVCDPDASLLIPGGSCGLGVEADRWAPRMPANVRRLVRALPSSPCDVEAAVDPDGVKVLIRPKGPAGAFFADFDPDAPLIPEPLADETDESWESGSAQAIPLPVKSAAPTPNATASPPTRPIYLKAFIHPPDSEHGCRCCGSCSAASP
jgi:hypothetical protein